MFYIHVGCPVFLSTIVSEIVLSEMYGLWKSTALGAVIRAWMFHSGYHDSLSDRVEISTPLNSWKRGIVRVRVSMVSGGKMLALLSLFFSRRRRILK